MTQGQTDARGKRRTMVMGQIFHFGGGRDGYHFVGVGDRLF